MAALGWTARGGGLPSAYLVTIVTRLCFNELDSAKARREENRGDRLPEPLDLDAGGIGHVEMLDQISMAFLVVLQRLTPAERARENVAKEKRSFSASLETHERLLAAFTQAASAGDLDALVSMRAEDAVMITDRGPEGRRVGGIRMLRQPLQGARWIAAFVAATARSTDLESEIHELNGQPALVFYERRLVVTKRLVLGLLIEGCELHAQALPGAGTRSFSQSTVMNSRTIISYA